VYFDAKYNWVASHKCEFITLGKQTSMERTNENWTDTSQYMEEGEIQ